MRLKHYRKTIKATLERISAILASPLGLSIAFAFLATTTTALCAYFEGRLLREEHLTLADGRSVSIIPFSRNISTLADFIFLNPLAIYFLQLSRIQRRIAEQRLKIKSRPAAYHRLGLSILCAVLGAYAMKFYVEGSPFYDATMIPSMGGQATITTTGWIVYSWTAAYIAWVLFAGFEHGFHITSILSLTARDIPYSPLNPDRAGGIKFLMDPSLSAGYAMIVLLTTFAIFIVHDRIIYHIHSNRLLGLAVYVVVAVPLFAMPFWKLHQLMKTRRDDYLFDSFEQALVDAQEAATRKDWVALAQYVAAVESVDKYRKLVSSFPVWPAPFVLALPSVSSIVVALVPLAQKFAASMVPSTWAIQLRSVNYPCVNLVVDVARGGAWS